MQAVISPIMTLIMMAILLAILGYGGARVSKGELSAGTLIAILFLLFQVFLPFAQLAQVFTGFQKAVGATKRIQQILQLESEPHDGQQNFSASSIHFQQVSFSYEAGKEVLHHVTFTAPVGTVTAFVGPSGSGKTTIFSLFERFYAPTTGQILWGDTPIDQIDLAEWRQKIGYVSQESPLLSGTILDNIAYGLKQKPSLEEIRRVAKLANALEFIDELQEGFKTPVGERGIKLSGGQRQRIAIARAFLHDPEILLLDEATSNLDSQSESHVQEALQQLMKGRTTFIIAHRLSTIVDADQILFLEKGTITGAGTHEQLMDSHPVYKAYTQGQGIFTENE